MANVRKTKKRLKRDYRNTIVILNKLESIKFPTLNECTRIYSGRWLVAYYELALGNLKPQGHLANLKKRVRRDYIRRNHRDLPSMAEMKRIIQQRDIVRDLKTFSHDVMPPMTPIPFAELGVKTFAELIENLKRKK